MKKLLLFALFVLSTACNFNSNNKTDFSNKKENSEIKKENRQLNSDIFLTDTLAINKHYYIQKSRNKSFYCLTSINGDTIIKPADYYFDIEYLDINEDGYDDIRIYFVSNIPNQCDNYLYNKELQKFILIQDCELDIQKIKGVPFYYSYNKAGCSDLNWESHLSKIENFKLINYGYILGHGCDFEVEKNPQSISVYKIISPKAMKLIQKLPYLKNIPKNEDKWSFIERYWQKNYRTFEK
ncbi:hypothetical protein [Flavobacterium chilense]|uniref:Lipoprotein n=1 Tax=Flavobacterium chilense TaxID=946677 RepID=A0A1M6XP40_9FLAO|nr:hypothetical protein [Flavobacterium chilense]SHL07782.1 hypothetical protein SAMN05444484_101223 [Flavobacterium chilense]